MVAHRLRHTALMNETQVAEASAWTCPFCPLACDHLRLRGGVGDAPLTLAGGECARASRALASFTDMRGAQPALNGAPCSLDEAISAAAAWLRASRQPLFAGLGTDVAGARALYPLACATGAVCDGGEALMQGLRALQDRGQFTTTLAEVRTRADVIVFIGGLPADVAPLIGARCGIGERQVAMRHIVVVGPAAADTATLASWAGQGGVSVESLPLSGDLFDTVSLLAALVDERLPGSASPALATLAQRLRQARYAVLVGAPPRLPAQGGLIVEGVHNIVGALNKTTRAAALWLGGGNGLATVNQAFTWLSGLPLRSRAGPRGLEHEPLCFDGARLLADGAVDALLWIASFDATSLPPPNALPTIVLGHPAMSGACRRPGLPTLFIPVATPGIGAAGHVFRTDGTVLMALHAVVDQGLPTVAEALLRLTRALHT